MCDKYMETDEFVLFNSGLKCPNSNCIHDRSTCIALNLATNDCFKDTAICSIADAVERLNRNCEKDQFETENALFSEVEIRLVSNIGFQRYD